MQGHTDVGFSANPVSYTCSCSCRNEPESGVVLLYYRYWSKPPLLRQDLQRKIDQPEELAAWYREITATHHLTGKIRVAKEGFNATMAGTKRDIQALMDTGATHWSFDGIALTTDEQRELYFKPTRGCACVFVGMSIKVCHEITPFGVTNYLPSAWDVIEELSPKAFHARCHEDRTVLLDVRNHYESRIGYFVDPLTGKSAVRPQIRRFSQFPKYIKTHGRDLAGNDQIMTYCTGGIRCEKAVRWMTESFGLVGTPIENMTKVCTLQGGIAAYLKWVEAEIKAGKLLPENSLFKGKNFVFDARGSTGLGDSSSTVATCHMCGVSEDRLSKCRSQGCQLVLVVCSTCEQDGPFCCEDCRGFNACEGQSTDAADRSRHMCDCETQRERSLWGEDERRPRKQGWKTAHRTKTGLHMPMKTFK